MAANGMSLAVIERMEARPPFKIATSATAGSIEPLPLSVSIEEIADPTSHNYNHSPNHHSPNQHPTTTTINNNNNNINNLPHPTTAPSPIAPHLSSPINPILNTFDYLDMSMSLKSHGSASIVDDSQKSFPLPPSQHGTYTKQMALAEGKDKQVKGGDVALARARQAYSLKLAHVAMLDKHQQNQVLIKGV